MGLLIAENCSDCTFVCVCVLWLCCFLISCMMSLCLGISYACMFVFVSCQPIDFIIMTLWYYYVRGYHKNIMWGCHYYCEFMLSLLFIPQSISVSPDCGFFKHIILLYLHYYDHIGRFTMIILVIPLFRAYSSIAPKQYESCQWHNMFMDQSWEIVPIHGFYTCRFTCDMHCIGFAWDL